VRTLSTAGDDNIRRRKKIIRHQPLSESKRRMTLNVPSNSLKNRPIQSKKVSFYKKQEEQTEE